MTLDHDTLVTAGDTDRTDSGASWQVHGVATPMVGRTREVHALNEMLKTAIEEGSTQTCILTGEIGMGKSRLLAEFHAQLDKHFDIVTVARGECRADGGPPYQLFGRILRDRFYIGRGEDEESARRKLLDGIAAILPPDEAEEATHLIGLLIGLPFADSPYVEPGAADGATRAFQAMSRLMQADARRSPLVLVLEDLQWIGDGSNRLIGHLLETLRAAPVLLVVTGDPEVLGPEHDYLRQPGVAYEELRLDRLSDKESAKLLHETLRREKDLPKELIDLVVERSVGNPFTLESLVRMLLETRVIDPERTGRVVDMSLLDLKRFPASQPEVVKARLAVLTDEERALLQKAAVVGDTFWLGSVIALQRMDGDHWPEDDKLWNSSARDERVRSVLTGLRRKDIIRRSAHCRFVRDVEYVFKHRLERRALYPPDGPRRTGMHRLVAQWLEFKSAEGPGRLPVEELARHYEQAGDTTKAAYYHVHAGDQARSQFQNGRAIELYLKGLQELPEEEGVTRIETLHNLGNVYELIGEHDEALCYFREMARAAWLMANRAKGGVAFHKLGRAYRALGEYSFAMDHLERARDLFEDVGDVTGLASALDDIGRVHLLQGDLDVALALHEEGLALRRELGNPRSVALSLARIGTIHVIRGDFKGGLEALRESLDLRREVGDRRGEAESLNALAAIFGMREDLEQAVAVWSEALTAAREVGARELEAKVLNNLGEVGVQMGDLETAGKRLARALEITEASGARGMMVDVLRNLGRLAMVRGEIDEARQRCEQALKIAQKSGLKLMEGFVWATLGEVHSLTLFDTSRSAPGKGLGAEAEEAFSKAASVLSELGNEAELAKVLRIHGNALIERGAVEPGRKHLERAAELFRKLNLAGALAKTERTLADLPA